MNPPEHTQHAGARRWKCELCNRFFLSEGSSRVAHDWELHMSAVHQLYGSRLAEA